MNGKKPFSILWVFISFVIFLFILNIIYDSYFTKKEIKSNIEIASNNLNYSIRELFKSHVDKVAFQLKLLKNQYNINKISFTDMKELNKIFSEFVKIAPEVSSINIGDSKKNGYLFLKTKEGWKNRIKEANKFGVVTWFEFSDSGYLIKKEERFDNYDPTERPWYKLAEKNNQINFSDPYVFRTTRDVGITASLNLSEKKDYKLIIGMDIMLKDLSDLLSEELTEGKRYEFYLLRERGEIVASNDRNFKNLLEKKKLIPSFDDRDFKFLKKPLQEYVFDKKNFGEIESNGKTFFYNISKIIEITNEAYYIITVYDKKSLYKKFSSTLIIKSIFLIIFLVSASIFYVRHYIAPIINLNNAIKKFRTNGFLPVLKKRQDEIGELSSEIERFIADINQKELNLKSLLNYYSIIFFNNPAPLVICEKESGKIQDINKAFIDTFGYSKKALLNEDIKNLIISIDHTFFIKKYGVKTPVELFKNSFTIDNKEFEIISIIDISEKISLEEKRAQLKKLETVGRLGAGFAHQFNNMLTAIIGYASLAEALSSGNKELNGYIQNILKVSNKAAQLVSAILSYSGKQMVFKNTIKINEFINLLKDDFRHLVGDKISLYIKLPEEDAEVMADKELLFVAIKNILENARESIQDSGTITISVEKIGDLKGYENDIIRFNPHFFGEELKDSYIRIAISDTGKGIEEHILNKVFEPFFSTKGVDRKGLGLSSAYGIILSHQGFMTIESIENEGTCVNIFIPV